MSKPTTLLWLDLETTGLDVNEDHILECAVFLTDSDGSNPRNYRNWVVVPYDQFWQQRMGEYVTDMHTQNGLLKDVQEIGIDRIQFEDEFHDYLDKFRPDLDEDGKEQKFTLAGSGVGPFDRIILKNQYPWTESYLNYYVMDVGVIGRFIRHCCGMQGEWGDRNDVKHRAMDDIKDHYEEFLFYRGWCTP